MMICITNCLYNQNATLWTTLMTTKSTRRSPNRRINSPSSSTTQIRRIRNHSNYNNTKPSIKNTLLPIYSISIMRSNYNWFNLPTTNRFKIINRLLISKPHRSCYCCNTNTNPMSIHRCYYTYNRPWINIINTLLSG